MPHLETEKKLWRKGFKYIAGLDEAGRGALTGPVVAAAVMVNSRIFTNLPRISRIREISENFAKIRELKDSKKLTPKKREEFYKILIKHPAIEWGIGRVSERVIDKINILEATKLAMIRAIKKLKRKPDFLILDGKMKLDLPTPQKSIVKADEKVFSCSAASILAKVSRDRSMTKLSKKFPKYRFAKHKGYGTKEHYYLLHKHGPCPCHRQSFRLQ